MAYAYITDCERKGKPNKKAETPSGCGVVTDFLDCGTQFSRNTWNLLTSNKVEVILVFLSGVKGLTDPGNDEENKGHSRDTLQDEGPHNCLGITVEYDEEHQKQHIHTI